MYVVLILALIGELGGPPEIQSASANPRLAQVGQAVSFSVTATDPDGDALQYSWSFNDGSPPTPFSASPDATCTYSTPGHYLVLVTVTDGQVQTSKSFYVGVTFPPTIPQPTSSSTILHDAGRNRVWCVNPDSDSVAAIDGTALTKVWEGSVGKNPRTLAQAPDGTIWVTGQDDATLRVLARDTGAEVQKIVLPYGSRPYGIAFSPDGAAGYVTLEATGRLLKLDPSSRSVVGSVLVCPTPRGIAITGDSRRILVTRFISPTDRGEVVEVAATNFTVARTFTLALDPGPDTSDSSRGVPNYLGSITITPDGRRAWVPSKKDNTARGISRDGMPLTFETAVRTIVSQIDLMSNQEDLAARIDLNNSDLAAAVRFSPAGDLAFVALQGSSAVSVLDRYEAGTSFGTLPAAGLAPQGLAFDAGGTKLFIQNFMSRTTAVYDTGGVVGLTSFSAPLSATVSTVANEKLPPAVLLGKQVFYNANNGPRDHDGRNKINTDGYLSCATCHLEGNSDHRVWDFTQAGEGLRNTISLLGRRGTGHGRVHWSANFDEIQDFEHPIRDLFGGAGLMSDADFETGTRNNPLGDPKAGLSVELDALAAYVASLDRVRASPYRNADGTLTPEALAGKSLFQVLNCVSCHAGPDFTDSAGGLLHDVGTIKSSSGQRLGGALNGLDTPTLKGIWESAPYLHDGSAATLLDVLTTADPAGKHGNLSSLTVQEKQQLAAYLQQIDESEAEPPPSLLFIAELTGSQGVPPTGSGGKGLGKVVLKSDGATALVSLSLSGLTGTQTGAFLHGPAPAGSAGPIVFTLPPGSFTDFALTLAPDQAQQLKDGLLYFNVPTGAWPGGEIRGQIAVPAPPKGDEPPAGTSEGGGGGCGATGLEYALILGLVRALRRRREE